jgi:hypothetical protein
MLSKFCILTIAQVPELGAWGGFGGGEAPPEKAKLCAHESSAESVQIYLKKNT